MRRTEAIQAYLTTEEKAALNRVIKQVGLSESSYARMVLMGSVKNFEVVTRPTQQQQEQGATS